MTTINHIIKSIIYYVLSVLPKHGTGQRVNVHANSFHCCKEGIGGQHCHR